MQPRRAASGAGEGIDKVIGTMTFAAFYRELQQREGITTPRDLIGPWRPDRRDCIAAMLTAAFDAAGILRATVPGIVGSTPQSAGNKAAAFLRVRLSAVLKGRFPAILRRMRAFASNRRLTAVSTRKLTSLRGYSLEVIQGAGYPDFVLRWKGGWCCAEVKSTAKPIGQTSSLRIVITGSSDRLRREVQRNGRSKDPPCHLLFTLQHDPAGVVRSMRLDFLEPDTEISVKFEASTSQQQLVDGVHQSYQHPRPASMLRRAS